ncbi:MAG: sulfatase family protein [Planctomycetota bacterium]|jgi:arylsulfatase A-like enzyme
MKPTNLLFLYTDEQARRTMAAYGNERIQVPNLNRLATESTVFERAYVTQPVCTPSRSSILTGLYPHTTDCTANNVPLPDQVPCLPEMLPPGKYATAHFGKWHLGDEVFAQHGFNEWRSIEDCYWPHYGPGRDREHRSTYHRFLVENGFEPADGDRFSRGQAARLPEQYGKPAYLAGEACRFLRENRRNPFVLFVNFLEPHMPFFGPRDDQHDPDQVILPQNLAAFPTADQPARARRLRERTCERGHSGLPLRTEADWRRMIASYWGLCSLVDTYVGEILAALEDCGLAESTIVVYTSDHGDMMGGHGLITKCVMFEEAVSVPLLARLPGQGAGRRVAGPVSQIDLVPTLLDLMGEAVPEGLQGQSLKGLIEGDAGPPQSDVFIEWNVRAPEGPDPRQSPQNAYESTGDFIRGIVTPDRWKFNWSALGEHELYSLNEDPGETTNLAGRAGSAPLMRDLAGRIRRWQEVTADALRLPAL